ncbi:peptidoglycan-binding protein [Enemella evansiae]|uniref:Peptidase n=1 Tax=Enemella evansiae TaxID=2016499 RepID=A0A255GKP6_9ACTN|nr:peptidoglycan-binding protein [Enemella evansiae]OYO16151.1 peptidase [Enemella evansiae]OYO18505.1 peptidase [Enemella evansiae]TDO84815.1 peptidoglycan hydrolase-like protein with peptidoglycan-binding domain [Enemella evansiae]
MKLRKKILVTAAATLAVTAPTLAVVNTVAPAATADAAGIPTSGLPVLKQGATGNAVKAIQAAVGTGVDGSYGPKTVAAVKAFQKSKGLSADGVTGPKTWDKALGVVRYGSKGTAVKALQGRLGLQVDGNFGPKTKASVINFQRTNGLSADGVVGPATWSKLLRGSSGGSGGSGGGSGSCPNPRNFANGKLPSSALVAVPGNSKEQMSCTLLKDYTAMNNAFKAAHGGRDITVNDGYRSLARQQYFWDCYKTKKCNNGNLAARPGTSNHGWGRAFDVGRDGRDWLHRNAGKYGFVFDVSSESWHMTYKR